MESGAIMGRSNESPARDQCSKGNLYLMAYSEERERNTICISFLSEKNYLDLPYLVI